MHINLQNKRSFVLCLSLITPRNWHRMKFYRKPLRHVVLSLTFHEEQALARIIDAKINYWTNSKNKESRKLKYFMLSWHSRLKEFFKLLEIKREQHEMRIEKKKLWSEIGKVKISSICAFSNSFAMRHSNWARWNSSFVIIIEFWLLI